MLQILNSDKYLTVSEWQGVTRVHLRNFMRLQEDGPLIPTKKGIALTIDEWQCFKNHINEVDALLQQAGTSEQQQKQPTAPPAQAVPTAALVGLTLPTYPGRFGGTQTCDSGVGHAVSFEEARKHMGY